MFLFINFSEKQGCDDYLFSENGEEYFFIEHFQDQLDEYSRFYRCDLEICGLTSKLLTAQPESDKFFLFFAVFLVPLSLCFFLACFRIKSLKNYYCECVLI